MPRWKKFPLIAVAIILSMMLLSMLIVPWQIKEQGSKWFAENTTRTLSIEKAFFNPFALTVEVKGVTLTEQQSPSPFVSLDRLMISASISSLLDMAVILDRVELENPSVNIVQLDKQEFSFSDFTRLGDGKPKPAEEEPSNPVPFSLNNIVINGGQVNFSDQTSPRKSQHQIREFDLSVPFVGNVPYLLDEYIEPKLRMILNGSEISAIGQLKPFHKSLETSLSLVLNEIELPFYAFHSPVPLPVDIQSGTLDAQIDLTYRISAAEEPKLMLGGELALSDIDIRQLDGEDLFRMPTLILDLDWADLMKLDFNLLSLDIYEPEVFVSRDAEGLWNFEKLSPAKKETAKPPAEGPEETEKTELPPVQIVELNLYDGKVHFQDQLPPGGVQEELHSINLQAQQLSTLLYQKTGLEFRMATDRLLTTEIKGEVGINPPSAAIDLAVNGVPLEPYYPYLAEVLTAPIAGNLTVSSSINYTEDGNIQLHQAQLALSELKVPFNGKDQFTLTDLLLSDGSFDLQQRQASLASVKLSGGNLRASRLADGNFSPLRLLRPQPEAAEQKPAEPQEPAPQFAVKVDLFELEDFDLGFTDASMVKKPQLKIDQLNISMADLAYPESLQSPFKISAKVGKKGAVDLSGTLAHSPLRLKAKTKVKALALADYNDFLPENVNVSLKDGKLYTTMSVTLQEQPETMTGNFGGSIMVSDLNLRDPLDNGELLTWENLNLTGISGEISPVKLNIKEVSLSKYLAKIQIDSEGQVNLANVTATEEEGEEEAEPESEPVAVAVEEKPDAGPAPDISIDALTLQGGTVSFSDRSLTNAFSTTMYKLGGRVTGMSSNEEMQADVDLRGELENHSPLTITGKLNPLSKNLYADLSIKFKDIDLAPLTPYSGTYVGYVIDKGKLYLDLSYHIENQNIKAENKIMIDQFTFGDAVESDKATSLPVGLAIALLKDTNDEIHLDVPISGDLNDPSFSIMGTVFTVLKNLLVKAATSPFSLLASALGGGDEDFSSLSFASGVARLDEKQLELLNKLAGILNKRPGLTLEISGFADQDKDPEGYRKDQLQQKMIDAKWLDLKEAAQAPESRELVSISPEEYPTYLLRVYKEAEFPRPRNFVGMLKKLPDTEMEKLLLANVRAGDAELQELAKNRALLVRDRLIIENDAIKPRVFLKRTDIYQAPKSGPASRVELNISTK